MYHIGLQTLRAKIRGLHAAGSTVSRRISKSEKERRYCLWQLKRQLGDDCRHHLIAYAILRGVAYDKVERCSKENLPNPQRVLDIVEVHNTWVFGKPHLKYDLPRIEALLACPVRSEAGTRSAHVPSAGGARSQGPEAQMTAPTMAQEKGVGGR